VTNRVRASRSCAARSVESKTNCPKLKVRTLLAANHRRPAQLVGYTLRSGPSITVGEYAKVSYRPLSSSPYREPGGEDSRTPF
jgi:hypothetical protein